MTTATMQTTLDTLRTIRDFTKDSDMPVQQVCILLHVAMNPGQSMVQIAEATGLAPNSISRNCSRLGRGISWDKPGDDLIVVEEYIHDRRVKVVKPSQKLTALVEQIETKVVPRARAMFKRAIERAQEREIA